MFDGQHLNLMKPQGTLVMHTATGTLRARAIAKCSLDIPINPAFAATIKSTKDGAPDVRPK